MNENDEKKICPPINGIIIFRVRPDEMFIHNLSGVIRFRLCDTRSK